MYTEHFGLNEKPFSISPDPRYLYLSQLHADALAHLLYGIAESGGFIQLTGEVGTGKTTLIRSLLGQLPEKTEIALILNPQLSTKQFLQAICHELHVPSVARDTAKALIDKLNSRLLELHADNHRVVLIVDEAQTMSPELLEQVRLLTNLETAERKLLQIILIGQPELREVLGRREMRQVAQRITGRYHLEPLSAPDISVYVAHRMKVAGGRPETFSKRAIRKLYRLSHGVPRLINVIADRALLAAYARDETRIGAALVGKAADEVFGRSRALRWWPWAAAIAAIALGLFVTSAGDHIDTRQTLQLALAERVDIASGIEPALDAPPIAAAATATTPRLTELLVRGPTDRQQALATLLALWDLEATSNALPPCDYAATQLLRCLTLRNAPLGELRQLNRPIALELADGSDAIHYVVLLGLDESHARLAIGDRIEHLPIAELSLFGFGEQVLLFRPAIPDAAGALQQGAVGPGVVWLRTTLASIGGENPVSAEPTLFDAELTAQVRQYQQQRGLVVDGVVGDRTLLSLQNDIDLIGVALAPKVY